LISSSYKIKFTGIFL